jgi:predicted mannosyl-3-phosphoglycerate phosphatase (HAD superfamily)
LSPTAAELARRREHSETVRMDAGPEAWRRLHAALGRRGLRTWGLGPTATVVGADADKGRAVTLLTELYLRRGPVMTLALGDGANDEPMLEAVDRAFLVERPGGGWTDMDVPGLERVRGVGPVGWARAVETLLKELEEA